MEVGSDVPYNVEIGNLSGVPNMKHSPWPTKSEAAKATGTDPDTLDSKHAPDGHAPDSIVVISVSEDGVASAYVRPGAIPNPYAVLGLMQVIVRDILNAQGHGETNATQGATDAAN